MGYLFVGGIYYILFGLAAFRTMIGEKKKNWQPNTNHLYTMQMKLLTFHTLTIIQPIEACK